MEKTLAKYSPIILDKELTREMDEEMEKMVEKNETHSELDKDKEKIIHKAKTAITKIAEDITKHMDKIGAELADASDELREEEKESNMLTECPVCKKGRLRILYGRAYKRYFIACSNYPECKNKYSLPPYGLMKPCIKSKKAQEEQQLEEENDKKEKTKKKEETEERNDIELCPECKFPLMLAIQKGKRPWKFCFNPLCPSRKRQEEYKKEHPKKRSEKQEEEDEERKKVAMKDEE
jgi:DNA topoisomerase-1